MDTHTIKNHAPIGKRILAFIADFLIIDIVIFWAFQNAFAQVFFAKTFKEAMQSAQSINPAVYFLLLVVALLMLFYHTFFEYYLGQTPGQMFFTIRVIDRVKGEVGFWKALTRNLYILPFFPFYIFWIIEPIYLAFYKERFLERITNTATINADAYSTPENRSWKSYPFKKVK